MSLPQTAFDLSGRIALVTGGASGIGAGIAASLCAGGATVVIADINAALAQEQVDLLTRAGYKAGHVTIDLADEESIVRGCTETLERFGTPWVLVNNAGLQDRQLLLQGTAAEWDRINTVNARAPYLMTREIARAMIAAHSGGRIIHIASAALIGSVVSGLSAYAASKAALLGLMRASAMELVEHAITVNTLLPGGVPTPGALGAKGPTPQGPARRLPPLGMCEPGDIGAAVCFFASPAARAVTNQVLAVDGGWSLT